MLVARFSRSQRSGSQPSDHGEARPTGRTYVAHPYNKVVIGNATELTWAGLLEGFRGHPGCAKS